MSTNDFNPENSPIIQIERRKAVAFIVAAAILALSLGFGLTKVGPQPQQITRYGHSMFH
jgi:hypothetical protein